MVSNENSDINRRYSWFLSLFFYIFHLGKFKYSSIWPCSILRILWVIRNSSWSICAFILIMAAICCSIFSITSWTVPQFYTEESSIPSFSKNSPIVSSFILFFIYSKSTFFLLVLFLQNFSGFWGLFWGVLLYLAFIFSGANSESIGLGFTGFWLDPTRLAAWNKNFVLLFLNNCYFSESSLVIKVCPILISTYPKVSTFYMLVSRKEWIFWARFCCNVSRLINASENRALWMSSKSRGWAKSDNLFCLAM